jgi:hypothetical protein
MLALFASCLAACGTAGEETMTAPPISLNQGNGVVLTVQGAGIVDFATPGFGNADFMFIAHKKADGTVTGHFRMSRTVPAGTTTTAGTVDFGGIVTCVTIDPAFPGRARIGGVVTENSSTASGHLTGNHEVGDDVWFRVTDSDHGLDAADASTTYGFKPTLVETSAQYCALPFTGLPAWNPGSIFPLQQGTIQVKVR